jgi:hypothetical protein
MHEIKILSSDDINDVSSLTNVHSVKLIDRKNVSDVSALGNVHDLNLTACINVRDVSCLGKVHRLVLCDCSLVTDLSGLSNVYSLIFLRFQGTDLSGLRNIVNLNVSEAPNIVRITKLPKLETLYTERCSQLVRLTELTSLRGLFTSNPLPFSSSGILSQVSQLLVDTTRSPVSIPSVPFRLLLGSWQMHSIRFLCLASDIIEEIPTQLVHVQHLILIRCNNFKALRPLPVLEHCEITGCKRIVSLGFSSSNLRNSEQALCYLQIKKCSNLNEIIFNRKVFKCTLMNCKRLQRLETNKQIAVLKVDGCPLVQTIPGMALIRLKLLQNITRVQTRRR